MTPNSRSYITHLTQPDTIIPDLKNPQALNRYSYSNNNPLNFTDPSGHYPASACENGRWHMPEASYQSCLKGSDNYNYDGEEAADWAEEHWDDPEYCAGASCTAFVSHALEAGGQKIPGKWSTDRCQMGDDTWVFTDSLYVYLLAQGWTEKYVHLGDGTYFLYNAIPAGSVVFYEYAPGEEIYRMRNGERDYIRFEHAAITTGNTTQFTTKFSGETTYFGAPEVVDQTNGWKQGPHSVVDTSQKKNIVILVPPQFSSTKRKP